MGSFGNFLLGGSSQKQKSSNSSSSSSENQSQNSSVQGSTNVSQSGQGSASNSNGYNLSYGPVAAAMNPTLGYTAAGGNMLGALLGIPGYSMSGGPAPANPAPFAYTPPSPVSVPSVPTASPTTGTDQLKSLIDTLQNASESTTAPTVTTPATTPEQGTPLTPSPVGTSVPAYDYSGVVGGPGRARTSVGDLTYLASKADGGPVPQAQPTLVGEKGPEVFVPNTSGTVVPNGSPMVNSMFGGSTSSPQSNALNNYFNSAGGQFLMNKGQNAINSNAAARGVFQSGATGKALQDYGQGLASTYMNDYINHVLDFSKLGLGGASAMTGAGGVNNSTSQSVGSSLSTGASVGNSQGSSTGTSTSTGTGTSSGSGSAKNGLIPDLTKAAGAYAAGGGTF